jgi:hypothetical protein
MPKLRSRPAAKIERGVRLSMMMSQDAIVKNTDKESN